MDKRLYVDFHAIQTVPPSCVNRDDTGSPKTAVYGGVERARVSSQAWKRAMRVYFSQVFGTEYLGKRTKLMPKLIAEEMMKQNSDLVADKAQKAAMDALKTLGIKLDEKEGKNAALFFISNGQIREIAKLAAANSKDKKQYEKVMKDNPSFDIVLFGRMVADDPDLNYDAAAQVAHAISTHGVHTEYDYFTAVDDEQGDDESGAGHLGTIEFNSSTLYRYATINITELAHHLGTDTDKVIRGFAEAFIRSMPTGKQNTFANRTLPDMVYITIREDQPVNLCGAFERPVRNSKDGYVEVSCRSLLTYAEKVYSTFADKPVLALGCGDEAILNGHACSMSCKEMLDKLEENISQYIGKEQS